ncbi:MAG: hypothetical protein KBS58_01950 [Bacteroidales bacterium]|nr:hypothetical protein [Candidatus Cacconaster equi]
MKYLIRSIKSLFYFVIIFFVLVFIMFLFTGQKSQGMHFSDMFQAGSLPKLVLFFVAFGAIYPAVSFFKRKLYTNKDYAEHRNLIVSTMEDMGYEVEKEEDGIVSFRKKNTLQRFSRLFCEDRITMDTNENPIIVEGYRKDVMRILSTLSFKIRKAEGEELN